MKNPPVHPPLLRSGHTSTPPPPAIFAGVKHTHFRSRLAAVALLAGLAACNESSTTDADRAKGSTASSPDRDILLQNRDTTARPQDDFFQYANGAWIKANPIPADETQWGIAHAVQEEIYTRKRAINEGAVKDGSKDGIQKKIADFWTVAMDSAKADADGIQPLQAELARIQAAQSPADVMAVAAHQHTIGVGSFFSEGVSQDAKRSDAMAYYLNQGGLGMPNRDYYFGTDARTAKIRAAYPAFVGKMLALAGGGDSATVAKRAAAVVALETALAKASRKLEDLRDPYANYNKMAVAGLGKMSPKIAWPAVMTGIGVPSLDSVIVGQPEFYTALDKAVHSTPLPVLKDYLTFHLLRTYAPYLSAPFVSAHFDFYGKTVRGAQGLRPRWKRVLDAEEDAMGEALGQLFAKEYFDEKAKARYSEMVEKVREAYRVRILALDWMSDSTKQKALAKLKAMTKKVGYPDKWKDFSALEVGTASWAQNMMAANGWWNRYYLAKLGKPVDRTEWEMTPQTYNAYYNPSNNEIVLPAGIFTVPGFRDEELDDALVYGYAAASTIGHEITHGFDDEGRQFDAQGNLQSWWTPADEAAFKKRADVLVRQFSGIVALDTARINGRATLGENLADLGGLLLGVDAFKTTDAYKSGKPINGLMPMQRYFLGYALGWLYSIRDEELATRLLTDVHSPAKWRVNGPLPNVPAFYEAFGVKPGDKLYLPDSARVRLW